MSKFRYSLNGGASWTTIDATLPYNIPSAPTDTVLVEPLGATVTNPGVVPFLGQVATRATIPRVLTTNKQANASSGHIAKQNITSLQVAYANWYSTNVLSEVGSGGNAIFFASVEYPIGAARQSFLWAAATSVTVGNGLTSPLSDALTLATPIPAGAAFKIWVYCNNAAGVCYSFNDAGLWNSGLGDAYEQAASGLANKTVTGTISATLTNRSLAPVAIVANTILASALIVGDSLAQGLFDTQDATGDVGLFARPIGVEFGYLSAGVSGKSLQSFLTVTARHAELAAYFSSVVTNYPSVNDFSLGRTAAQMKTDAQSLAAVFPGKPVYFATMQPRSTSTDGWTTLASQAVLAAYVDIPVNNANVRAGFTGAAGYFEFADQMHSTRDSGFWKPATPAITGDGVHPTTAEYATLAAAMGAAIRERIHRY